MVKEEVDRSLEAGEIIEMVKEEVDCCYKPGSYSHVDMPIGFLTSSW
jgi:hypothetical protein